MIDIPSRRRFLFGVATLLAAPAIVRVASLMVVKPLPISAPIWKADIGYIFDGEVSSLRILGAAMSPEQELAAYTVLKAYTDSITAFPFPKA